MSTTLFGPRECLGAPLLPSFTAVVLDGSGDRLAGRFRAPKAGTIDRIACYCTAVSTPVSTEARLESITAGAPSGSLIAANTNGTFTPAAATLFVVTLTASRVVAAGDLFACVLNAPTADGSHTQTFNLRDAPTLAVPTGASPLYPRAMNDLSAGTYTEVNFIPSIVPIYSDGTYIHGCIPNGASSTIAISNASTPDERGNRFTQIGNLTCIGARIYIRGNVAGGNWNIKLYPVTSDAAAPLGTSSSVHADVIFATATTGLMDVFWDGADLVDGTDYRMTFQPSTANNITISTVTYANADIRRAASHYYATSRTRTADGDAGAWTDVDTDNIFLWPLYSQSNSSGTGTKAPLIGPGQLVRN